MKSLRRETADANKVSLDSDLKPAPAPEDFFVISIDENQIPGVLNSFLLSKIIDQFRLKGGTAQNTHQNVLAVSIEVDGSQYVMMKKKTDQVLNDGGGPGRPSAHIKLPDGRQRLVRRTKQGRAFVLVDKRKVTLASLKGQLRYV
jgi:hypothetical protein